MSTWKSEMTEAIEDYMINPCLSTGRRMLDAALRRSADCDRCGKEFREHHWQSDACPGFVPDEGVNRAGIVKAVAEEAKRIGVPGWKGPVYLGYRFFLGLGRLMTWQN